jgi:molecular chaperone GrpE
MTGPTDQDNGTGAAGEAATEAVVDDAAAPGGTAPGGGGAAQPPGVGEAPGSAGDEPPGAGEAPDPFAVVSAERDEYLDALRRLQAEFDNYRKRVARQQAEAGDRAAAGLVEKLLPVLDTLDLAAAHLGEEPGPDGTALLQAAAQLNDVLAKEGLERIDPTGLPFDPTAHEAVGHEPAPEPEPVPEGAPATGEGGSEAGGTDGAPAGNEPGGDDGGAVVARVMRAGFRWRGAVVRPAMVTVRG